MTRALVTGASAGLGRALAERMAADGADILAVDRAHGVPGAGIRHLGCDLADRPALDAVLPEILAGGPYDIVILNAGVSATGRFEDIPFEAYRRLLAVNLEAPIVIADALLAAGAVRRLAFVASLSVFTGYPGAAVYAASKEGIAAYAASVRKRHRRAGVTVTLACPGPLRTDHAARHAPAGSDPDRRMEPTVAAASILASIRAGRSLAIPGTANKAFALAGKVLPGFVTRRMRSLIYDRLDGAVW